MTKTSTRDLGLDVERPVKLLHESGPRQFRQWFDWTQTYRVGTGESRHTVRLILHVDSIAEQSRIRSEVWLSGQGWSEVLTYSAFDFDKDSLPSPYIHSDVARERGEAMLAVLSIDVLRFLGMS